MEDFNNNQNGTFGNASESTPQNVPENRTVNADINAAESYNANSDVTPGENSAAPTQQNPYVNGEPTDFYSSGQYLSPVYVTEKRGVNPLAVILPAAAAVIAAAVVFLILMLNKPESCREAEKKFFGSIFSAAEQAGDNIDDIMKPEKLTVDFSTPLGDLSGIDLSNYSLEMDTASGDNASYALIKAVLGGDIDLTAEMWRDKTTRKNYIFLPEISEIYLVEDYSQFTPSTEDYSETYEALGRAAEKTLDVYFDMIGEPETEKNVRFTVNGSEYTADKAVIRLNDGQLALLFKTFLENMNSDPITADLLCKIGEFENLEEMRGELAEITAELQKSIDNADVENAVIEMTVYIKHGTVIGRETVIPNYENGESVSVNYFHIPVEDGETGYFSYLSGDSDDSGLTAMKLSCEDKITGGVHNGNVFFSMNYDGSNVTISADYSDISVDGGNYGGVIDISVSGADDILGTSGGNIFSVKISLSKDGEKKITSITVPNICTVNVTLEPSQLQFKEVPTPSEDNTAVVRGDFEDDNGALERFFEDISAHFFPELYYGYGYSENDDKLVIPAKENEPSTERKPLSESGIIGSWKPVRVTAFDEEYDLTDEDFGSLVYTFTADGILNVISEAEGICEEYTIYFDGEENCILLEEDIYSMIYYDEASDIVTVCDDSGMMTVWFERV